jgi:ATP-dependent DNA helicase PIF1
MISYSVLRMIHLRLQQFKNNNELNFGGCNIILMGDLLQLKPIYGGCIFEQPGILGSEINFWKLFDMNILWRNQRHIGDVEYGDLCGRIRTGQHTAKDIKTLNDRMIYYYNNKQEFEDAIHLCSTKNAVNKQNQIGLSKVSKNNKLYEIIASDTYACGENINKKVLKKHLYPDEANCGGISSSISICVGARVMLRRNKDIQIGLVNGAMGTVTGFQWPLLARDQAKPGDIPEAVLIKFDDPDIAANYYDKEGESVIIRPLSVNFDGKE